LVVEVRKSAGFGGRVEAGAVSHISMGRRRCGSDVGPKPQHLVRYKGGLGHDYQTHQIIAAMHKGWGLAVRPCSTDWDE
jgi:hypothetical protein